MWTRQKLVVFTFCKTVTTLDLPEGEKTQHFENIVGKGENAGNQHFLLFPTIFSTL